MKNLLETRFLTAQVEKLDLPSALVVRDNEPVGSSISRMCEFNNHCALVVDKAEALVGIVTERDVIKKIALDEERTFPLTISQVMTPNPVCVRSNASVARALYEMSLGGFRHLPITAASPKVLSTEEVVDFVYTNLTKRIADTPIDFERESVLDKFFRNDIGILDPSSPVIIHEDQPVSVALKRLKEKNIGAVMLVNGARRLTGIFTERDYLFRVAGEKLPSESTQLKAVMTREPKTLLENASLSLAFNMMSKGKFRHIPIVDHMEELVATVSVRNFISYLNDKIMHQIEVHK